MKITKQYMAGFFDGEGSIGIYTRKDRYQGACARTQVTQNKTREAMDIFKNFQSLYGGNISEQKTLSGGIKLNWQLNPKGVEKFLGDMLPYLILKQMQARLVLYWIKHRPKKKHDGKGHTIAFSKDEISFNYKIMQAIKEMKKKDIDVVMAEQADLVDILVKLEPLGVVKG